MTSRSSGPGSESGAGFTLIEMIVVLVVLGVMLALVVERGPMRSPTFEARAAAREIAQELRGARAKAIAANRAVDFMLDVDRHRFNVDAGPVKFIPPWLDVAAVAASGVARGVRISSIRFAPDGSSSGGRIELARGEMHFRIGVDWLTGRVNFADGR